MDEDFSTILNKFSEILQEKNIDLNDIINNQSSESSGNSEFDFDINTILKFKEIMDNMNKSNSPRNQLLNSLRPYLEDTKKEKLDTYIKIANLLSVLDSLDNNQYLKFLKNSNYDFVLMLILFLLIF